MAADVIKGDELTTKGDELTKDKEPKEVPEEPKKKQGNFAVPEVLAKWKRKYGEVFEFSHCYDEANQKYYVGYFHKPDINVLANSMRYTNSDPMKAKQIVFMGCKIECDKEMMEDVEIYLPLIMQVNALLDFKLVEVKNY